MKEKDIEYLRLISNITHDAMIQATPGYKKLVEAACKEAGEDVPSYLATFRYLHSNLKDLAISDSSANT